MKQSWRNSSPSALVSVFLTVILTVLISDFFPGKISLAASSMAGPTVVRRTDSNPTGELVAASDVVVRGQVRSQHSFWNADHSAIMTDSNVWVLYDVVGSTPQSVIVRTLGGDLPDENIGMQASHAPALHSGEDLLLYLRQEEGRFVVSQGEKGKFIVRDQQAENERTGAIIPLVDLLEATVASAGATMATLPDDWRMREVQAPLAPAAVENYAYGGVHWPGDSPIVSFYVNPTSAQSGSGDGGETAFLDAIRGAAATWTNVDTAAFTFEYAGPTAQQTVTQNYVNEIIFMDQGMDSGILGQARYWYTLPNRELIEADIWFNGAYDFDATGSPEPAEIDLQSVALHEFGHWLSLGHDDNPAAVMYYALYAGVLKRNLYQTDIDGISAIYPCTNNSCGPSPPTATPTATNTPLPPPTATPTATNTP
jgi:hypothetical protein